MFLRLFVIALVSAAAWAGLARESPGAASERPYVVRPADTLWSIATRHYAGDPREGVWRLRERNDLDGALLVPGRRLVLPSG